MAQIIRPRTQNGFRRGSSKIIRNKPMVPDEDLESNDDFDDTIENNIEVPRMIGPTQIVDTKAALSTTPSDITTNINNLNRIARRYYIDELGFYRLLDLEQKQYVCSNLNGTNMRSSRPDLTYFSEDSNSKNSNHQNNHDFTTRELRIDMGISHFDRTVGYEEWKRSWDDFMRAKLTKQEPVTLNNELKKRVRSGIPHDYRCKVWTALIRMRIKPIRNQYRYSEDLYNEILCKYVSRVELSDHRRDKTTTITDIVNDTNNNKNISTNSQRDTKRSVNLTSIRTNETMNSNNHLCQHRQESNEFCLDEAQEEAVEKCFKQIELDLLRTLPNNRHFEDPNSIGIQRVRRVLRAYACFNPKVGYCQGMNRLAAMALLVLPEEEAFWCLVAITQCIMPKDYYLKPWLAQVDCYVLNDLIKKKMPVLHEHLTKNDIQLTLFTWFFTIFVDGFRPELMLRIWDCFLLEGDKVLFRFALSILYIYQNELLEMNDFSTMSTYLSRLVSTTKLDAEHLFETFNDMNPLSSSTLLSRRDYHQKEMQRIIEDN